jgi:hypothetical protein
MRSERFSLLLVLPSVATPMVVRAEEPKFHRSTFGPAILTSGTRDLMLSSTVRAHRKL